MILKREWIDRCRTKWQDECWLLADIAKLAGCTPGTVKGIFDHKPSFTLDRIWYGLDKWLNPIHPPGAADKVHKGNELFPPESYGSVDSPEALKVLDKYFCAALTGILSHPETGIGVDLDVQETPLPAAIAAAARTMTECALMERDKILLVSRAAEKEASNGD